MHWGDDSVDENASEDSAKNNLFPRSIRRDTFEMRISAVSQLRSKGREKEIDIASQACLGSDLEESPSDQICSITFNRQTEE